MFLALIPFQAFSPTFSLLDASEYGEMHTGTKLLIATVQGDWITANLVSDALFISFLLKTGNTEKFMHINIDFIL